MEVNGQPHDTAALSPPSKEKIHSTGLLGGPQSDQEICGNRK